MFRSLFKERAIKKVPKSYIDTPLRIDERAQRANDFLFSVHQIEHHLFPQLINYLVVSYHIIFFVYSCVGCVSGFDSYMERNLIIIVVEECIIY